MSIPEKLRQELLDLVQMYSWKMRVDTKDMTNNERVYFLNSLVEVINAAKTIFDKAIENGYGDEKC